jgi:penicillin-binding protein 2
MLFKRRSQKVSFDEILLDSARVSKTARNSMSGRMELPLSTRNIYIVGALFLLVALWFTAHLFRLQVVNGAEYFEQSANNQIDRDVIVAERGVIYDRQGTLLAWNEQDVDGTNGFPMRAYIDSLGVGQLLGYVSYPQKDSAGFFFKTEYEGINGSESLFNTALAGKNGERLVEVNVLGQVISEHEVNEPVPGKDVHLSVDATLSEAMYSIIEAAVDEAGFRSGAAAIMDVKTGEILAMTSFPSYNPEIMSDGDDREQIAAYNNDDRFPFLNKVVGGTYIPGSIVKPFVAYGALAEGIIDPNKVIVSNGSITIPNPYNPSNPSVFNDWRAHGAMTMREAIAFSSNVYFYIIGGGFNEQKGLGITKMHEYFTMFGLGEKTNIALANEQAGNVPNPAWKKEVFDDDWRLGDTYFTAIGQYGFLSTPIQMLRAYGALANGGTLLTPHVEKDMQSEGVSLNLNQAQLRIIHEGMRKTVVMDGGTARGLEKSYVNIAAKSGTAELGVDNSRLNSWAAGFWPYEEPRYAFILLLENVDRSNRLGATTVMGRVMDWIYEHRPEYLSAASE